MRTPAHRLRSAFRVVRAIGAHPARALRVAYYASSDDGYSLGGYLRVRLSAGARRDAIAYLLSREDAGLVLSFDRGGVSWTVPAGDIVTTGLFRDGTFAGREIAAVVAWLRAHGYPLDGRRVIDLGANVGSTTIPLARQGFRVLAVEPVPSTFAFLEENVRNNDPDQRITILQRAVGRESEVFTIALTSHGSSHVVPESADPGTGAQTIEVQAEAIPELLRLGGVGPHEEIAFVWSDTEGCEGYVVATGSVLWEKGVPLYAEIQPGALDQVIGVSTFLELVSTSFRTFVGRRELVAQPESAAARPIGELRHELDSLGDVLLLP